MKSIVILSGKGGVGKSSISASLAVSFSKNNKIVCADCDVDASNLALLFKLITDEYKEWKPISTNKIAIIDKNKCSNCGKCIDTCYFNAILSGNNTPEISEFGCEGCGVCEIVCPEKAIKMIDINNAHIGFANTKYNFKIASAQLMPGSSGSGKIVSEVKKKAKEISPDSDYLIIDSAAGVGCPVIASVTGTDYAIIVTEPTPSGFYDMKKALNVVNHFNIKKGIIINKYDLNKEYTQKIELFAKNNNIKIITKIKFDKDIVKAMTKMVPIIDYNNQYVVIFDKIKKEILKEISQ